MSQLLQGKSKPEGFPFFRFFFPVPFLQKTTKLFLARCWSHLGAKGPKSIITGRDVLIKQPRILQGICRVIRLIGLLIKRQAVAEALRYGWPKVTNHLHTFIICDIKVYARNFIFQNLKIEFFFSAYFFVASSSLPPQCQAVLSISRHFLFVGTLDTAKWGFELQIKMGHVRWALGVGQLVTNHLG